MNIQRIFNALEEDNQNSGLGIICAELEAQGYTVTINGKSVVSEGFFCDECQEFEQKTNTFNFSLFKEDKFEQKFLIEFTDFHDFVIKKAVG